MIITTQKTIKELSWEFYDHAFDLEQEWRKSSSRLNDKELLEIFPEAKEIIPEKISEWEEKRADFSDIAKEKLILIKHWISDGFSRWFWREWVKVNEGEELLKIDIHIVRLKRFLLIAEGKIPKGRLTEEEIQRALDVPIETLLNQPLRKAGKALVGLCPLHNEKHPSFYIYQETNSCWCYGCNRGGDVINLVRLLHGHSFKEAVKYLIGK
jgi:hypothetical protein